MTQSELITSHHLALKAIIYIRQSTPNQTLTNQESLRLQYALEQKAVQLGWKTDNIETIDTDLGQTGAAVQHREGFKNLLTQVTMGEVGIILSFDVTRLSRNCSDWYPLLDICGYRHCLIADRDGIYDPSTANGRLLLGLKGQLAEVELNTIRARLTAGIVNKAQRGELALQLPIGLVRNELQQVNRDPNLEVQESIQQVFNTFLRVRTISKTLQHFNQHGLLMPRYNKIRQLEWRKPTIATLSNVLKNPAYAGAFAYGKTNTTRNGPAATDKVTRKVPQEKWKVLIPDKFPGYINWETYNKIQEMLKQNYAEYVNNKTRGIPRSGEALLHGLIYCGECGHKMVVQYKAGTRYLCNHLRTQYGIPVCQFIPANPVDNFVVDAFFKAISPIELDAYSSSISAQTMEEASVERVYQMRIERCRYQAQLAEKQFSQVDPDNRLVAAELEKRWEKTLQELKEAQSLLEQKKQTKPIPSLSEEIKAAFIDIGKKLPTIWEHKDLPEDKKKALLRSIIDKVVVHREKRDTLKIRVVWLGGDTTTTTITINVGSFNELSDKNKIEEIIIDMSKKGKSDKDIAEHLTNLGYRSPMKADFIPSTVQNIRLKHRLLQKKSQSHPMQVKGYLTVTQIAQSIGTTNYWVYDRINNGRIIIKKDSNGRYLFPDEHETIKLFKQLKDQLLYNLDFSQEYQDA
ncbi:recombinase family protein [Cysteiniphilum sp. 6C5]|uniref:recombinase family protein n=1 Tax=unclassified Cysteiniphilum TaxID=2610889 RepID=UPI003F83CE83